jgi:hypothetical protein
MIIIIMIMIIIITTTGDAITNILNETKKLG